MVRFFHKDDIQPIADIANNRFEVSPVTDADEVATVYRQARDSGNWDLIITFVNDNPGTTESDIAAATIGSSPANDRLVLILMAILDHLDIVVATQ